MDLFMDRMAVACMGEEDQVRHLPIEMAGQYIYPLLPGRSIVCRAGMGKV